MNLLQKSLAITLSCLSLSAAACINDRALSVSIDNDLLVPGSRDQDYTAGLALAYSSRTLNNSAFYFDGLMEGLESLIGVPEGQAVSYSVEVGLYGFTPEQARDSLPAADDRPYASLVYYSNSNDRFDPETLTAWRSVMTVGVLGLDTFGNLQRDVHKLTGSREARGWDQQISDGGEPTLRYQLIRQKALPSPHGRWQAKVSQQVSVGTITEAAVSVSARAGVLASTWWRFNPEASSYGEQLPLYHSADRERFVFFGAALKARAYNAFLQGQFRDSAHSFSGGDLKHALLEVWAGYSHGLGNGYRVQYLLRAHSSEVDQGVADRNVIWGGLTLNKTWF